jgi:hypothetical protein
MGLGCSQARLGIPGFVNLQGKGRGNECESVEVSCFPESE